MPAAAVRKHDDRHDLSEEHLDASEPAPIVLTPRDLEVFMAEWDNPSKPHPRLVEAARRYWNRRQSDAG